MPLVSVIVPNFNHEPYLVQRLESIFNQTFQDFEVILLDDASTDKSCDLLNRYANHPKVSHLIINSNNSGNTYHQWQKGINLATGDYIWIAESDDWSEISFLQTLMSGIAKNSSITLAYSQTYFIDKIHNIHGISRQAKLETVWNGKELICHDLAHHNPIYNASMAVFKRQAMENINPVFTSLRSCGDWYCWVHIASKGDVFISGKVLNYFRTHDLSVTSEAKISGHKFIDDINAIIAFKETNLITEEVFRDSLKRKHLEYKFSEFPYSKLVTNEIESLFYSRESTAKYALWLKKTYRKKLISRNIYKMFRLIHKVINTILRKCGFNYE